MEQPEPGEISARLRGTRAGAALLLAVLALYPADFRVSSRASVEGAIQRVAAAPFQGYIREAPALYVIDKLLSAGATVTAFDPEAMGNVKKLLGDRIGFSESPYEALNGADALIIATEWSLFRSPDFDKMTASLKDKVIFDGRNLYDLPVMQELGFYYNSIGRKTIIPKV